MDVIWLLIACIQVVEGSNLLLNKPSKQYNTQHGHYASNSNDGDPSTYSHTTAFWQGDLQGYYHIDSISVTSYGPSSGYLRNALIGVSANDVNCPNNEVFTCGEWPFEFLDTTLTFTCNHTQPVRFVRVYKGGSSSVVIMAEGSAQGTPINTLTGKRKGLTFERMMAEVVSSISSALTTEDVTECANECFYGQPCVAFSFSDTANPNCRLAVGMSTTSSSGWSTYKVKDCSIKLC